MASPNTAREEINTIRPNCAARIAEKLTAISRVGFAGVALSFVNYQDELPYFIETVLPLLREAGLRT